MKLKGLFVSAAIIMSITVSSAFAMPEKGFNKAGTEENGCTAGEWHKDKVEFINDPVTMLENKKAEIQELLKSNKITKERAEEWEKRIERKITEVKAFDKLTMEQKREKLINESKARLDKLVEKGRLTREKADVILTDITAKIKNWDGKGYPMYHGKGMKHRRKK